MTDSLKQAQTKPNILIIMTDDVGFGAANCFGGPIETPTMDALAEGGLRYNQFHTTAMCSPTRASLLTGRNHHSVNSGALTNVATDLDGYTSVIPPSAATVAQVLREHGYKTAMIGKNHNTPEWELTPSGPFDRWPTGLGFDYFYGFNGGETSQWHPDLVKGTARVEPPTDDPDYILDRDLADHAIDWLRTQTNLMPEDPFFLYFAPGTAHSPHQAPKEWVEHYAGRFDHGWDEENRSIYERQKGLGVIPESALLTPRPEEIPAWDTLTPNARKVAARMMELHAAQLSHFEHQLGRVFAELERSGRLENTLVFYVQGDNGASAEGGMDGAFTDGAPLNGMTMSADDIVDHLNELGGPLSGSNYPTGWAWAMNTPFQWMKQVASHFGGTRNGLVVSWPKQLRECGGQIRSQFHHVMDIVPTIYEILGVTPPQHYRGVEQQPHDGVDMSYSFLQAHAPSKHREQYFEILGNRAYYKDGWIASTRPGRPPWTIVSDVTAEDFTWELYHVDNDFSQAVDLAADYPDKLSELQQDFSNAAARFHVLPLNADFAGRIGSHNRPYVFNGRSEVTLYPTDTPYYSQAFPDIKNRSWVLEIDLVTNGSDSGTLISQGSWLGGWGLFLFRGIMTFLYKSADGITEPVRISSVRPMPAGDHLLRVKFDYDGGGRGRGGELTMEVDGEEVARGKLLHTTPNTFLGSASVGRSYGTPLTAEYEIPFRYQGDLGELRLTLSDPG